MCENCAFSTPNCAVNSSKPNITYHYSTWLNYDLITNKSIVKSLEMKGKGPTLTGSGPAQPKQVGLWWREPGRAASSPLGHRCFCSPILHEADLLTVSIKSLTTSAASRNVSTDCRALMHSGNMNASSSINDCNGTVLGVRCRLHTGQVWHGTVVPTPPAHWRDWPISCTISYLLLRNRKKKRKKKKLSKKKNDNQW